LKPQLRIVRDPSGRPPPHAPESERLVLGAVLVDETALDRVADIIDADHFWSGAHQRIFAIALELYRANKVATLAAVADALRDAEVLREVGGAAYLAELANTTPSVHHLEQHARTIRDKARVRALVATCQHLAAEGYSDIGEPQAWLEAAENKVGEITRSPEAGTMVPIKSVLNTVFTNIQANEERGSKGMIGLSTGFGELDDILAGLHPAELTLLAGRPGMGKTACGMAIALNVAGACKEGEPRNGVLFFSFEMSREQLSTRTICTEARVDMQRVRLGKLWENDWAKLTKAGSWLSAIPLWIDDKSGATPLDIRAKARRLARELERTTHTRLALVVVDYVQLVRARSMLPQNASREQEVSLASSYLKQLSKELNVPVLALAQLNRAVEKQKDKRPQLADLRESGALEQDADNVIFVHREEYYLKDRTPAADQGIAELIVAKQRNGPSGVAARLSFEARYALFKNSDTPTPGQEAAS
jgi:replicative DNA helicase